MIAVRAAAPGWDVGTDVVVVGSGIAGTSSQPHNAREFAASGVDYLSVGALTHSARVLDIGLDL